METHSNKGCNIENSDVEFKLYLTMIKNDTLTWDVFFQIMKDMISLLDLSKSKKLIFYLIEELKEFKYRDKVQLNKVSQLEESIEILRKENESLKTECNKLKGNFPSYFVPKESHTDFSGNSEDSTFVNEKEFESKMEIVTDIKIEELNIDQNIESVSTEIIGNDKNLDEKDNTQDQENIKLNHPSVQMICLSEPQVENYLKTNQEPINTKLNIAESSSKHCKRFDDTFSSLQSLKIHEVIVHDGLKKCKCDKCDKSLTQARTLKTPNETVHDGLKRYICKKCEKSFRKAWNLKVHIETVHENLKKYNCNKCGKSFGQASNFKRHNDTVHEGLKNYKCNKCEKSFSRAGDLKRHTEGVHEGLKKYKCSKCGISFGCENVFKKHFEVVHDCLQ